VADTFFDPDVLPTRTAAATGGTKEGQGLLDCLVSFFLLFGTTMVTKRFGEAELANTIIVLRLCAAAGSAVRHANAASIV
jgi:hypothetical protein